MGLMTPLPPSDSAIGGLAGASDAPGPVDRWPSPMSSALSGHSQALRLTHSLLRDSDSWL
jgi:hypothetical protein